MTTAIAAVADASLVAALALLVCRGLRRSPAAFRHGLLATALAAAAAAPLLEIALPGWEIAVLSSDPEVRASEPTLSSGSPTVTASAAIGTPAAPSVTLATALMGVWGVGVVAVLAGLLTGLARLVWVTRRCHPIRSGAWRQQADALTSQCGLPRPVVILESRDRALLLTWGLFRPRIIVPAGARGWAAERIQVVLAHELAHIQRRDWLLQIGAEAVRAVYWFNPLIWWTCRRLRDESEQACDDAVLRRGVDARAYASHLLAVARHVLADGRAWAPAPAVANSSTLERRIAAMLNASRSREPLTRASAALTLLAMLAVAAPLAAVTLTERSESPAVAATAARDVALSAAEPKVSTSPAQPPRRSAPRPRPAPAAPAAVAAASPEAPLPALAVAEIAAGAQQAPATLSGTVRDASGGVLPGVELSLTDLEGGIRYSRVTDGAGRYRFPDLPPSRYQLVASLAGFATITTVETLTAGQDFQRALDMRIGVVEERINVACAIGAAALPARATRVLAFDRRPVTTRLFTRPQGGTQITPQALAQQGTPVRVGGQIMAPRKIKDEAPVCPGTLVPPAGGVIVILEATIGTDGGVKDIRYLARRIWGLGDPPTSNLPDGEPQPEFVRSAVDAVRQWQFTPTRLNNVPVPVIMSVTVEFRRR
jgi:beta-lactamase regulating signal transducer with metallopeptidase domain